MLYLIDHNPAASCPRHSILAPRSLDDYTLGSLRYAPRGFASVKEALAAETLSKHAACMRISAGVVECSYEGFNCTAWRRRRFVVLHFVTYE